MRPGVLTEGVIVIASYREQNGEKVMTGIAVKGKKPSDSPKQN